MQATLIIPVFNGMKYFSFFKKNIIDIYNDPKYEIIVVDDGSNDLFHENLLKDFPNILYFYQKNQGSGIARNYGIKKATKDLVMFMDVDDEINKPELDHVISKIDGSIDINCFQAKRIHIAQNNKEVFWKKEVFKDEYIGPAFGSPNIIIDSIVMNKIFRRDFLIQSKVVFPEGKYEDKIFLTKLFLKNPLISINNVCFYKWMVFPNSVSQTNTKDIDDINQRFDSCEYQLFLAKDTPFFDVILSNIYNHDISLYSHNYKKMEPELKKLIFKRFLIFKQYHPVKNLSINGKIIYKSDSYKQLCKAMKRIDKNNPLNIIKKAIFKNIIIIMKFF
ncbi:glycosyltransferase [Leclercia sp.]|uniref:glycosyltransferase n=1 Tax=Leclercia sp. TaxID=1898428 RepID=UPI0028AACFC8|nr:glycosyltransferase [Leclercia sp.]